LGFAPEAFASLLQGQPLELACQCQGLDRDRLAGDLVHTLEYPTHAASADLLLQPESGHPPRRWASAGLNGFTGRVVGPQRRRRGVVVYQGKSSDTCRTIPEEVGVSPGTRQGSLRRLGCFFRK
jgi:hypothetical protein